MSAASVLQAAVLARLRATPALAECAWFDAPPVRAGLPCGVVEWPVLGDWSTKTNAGREGRLVLSIVDEGERPLRLRALAGAAEDAVPGLGGELGEGWRVAQLLLLRSRMARGRDERWTATSEFLVRVYRANG